MTKRAAIFLAFSAAIITAAYTKEAAAQVPTAVAVPGMTIVVSVQGEGAQIYECKAGKDGKLGWDFREPIATLILDGKTVGRHYAGPSWAYIDGSTITGKVVGMAAGEGLNDINWLKLDVVSHHGKGLLSDVSTVQRLNTHGGSLYGTCDHAGAFQSVPYSATYVFLRKAR